MYKKFLSTLLIFLLNILNIQYLDASSSSLVFDYLRLNWNSGYIEITPGENFWLDSRYTSASSVKIKEAKFNLNFKNSSWDDINSDFEFDWSKFKTIVYTFDSNTNIQNSDFTASWLSTFLTNTSSSDTSEVWNNDVLKFTRKDQWLKEWFYVKDSISDYQITINSNIVWKSVEDDSEISSLPFDSLSLFVNVNPHIVDYSFSSSSLVWNWVAQVDLTVKVKDYNWCTNIDWWTITADLSQLWLTSSENLTYISDSCEADWKTAVFKKTWIQTTSSVWDKTFTYDLFSATDEDWNSIMPNDSNTSFDDEDKKDSIVLTITEPNAPNVTINWITDNYTWPNEIWAPVNQLSFTSDQSWTYDVRINWNWTCTTWVSIDNWSLTSWVAIDNIDLDNYLADNLSYFNEWANLIYVCVTNWDWDIWSSNISITKDFVTPTVFSIWTSPANIVDWWTSDISFKCWENWSYRICDSDNCSWRIFKDWISAIKDTKYTFTLDNLNNWENKIYLKCRDNALNIWTWIWTVTEQESTPSMSTNVSSFTDSDSSWEWIDWRDLTVSWVTNIAESFEWFESYRIYILPDWITLNTSIHNYLAIAWWWDATVSSWVWSSSLKKDSAWNDFSTWTYKAYVSIMWVSWQLWEAWVVSWNLNYDNVINPSILSAKFISDNILEIQSDLNLKTDVSQHLSYSEDSIITYEVWWTTYTWTSVLSISWDRIQIQIPSLWWTWLSWANLTLWTWAIKADSWWYNNFISWILISDWVNPEISSFSLDSTSSYTTWSWADFYSWNLDFSYNFSEEMKAWWATKFQFIRESWNPDSISHNSLVTGAADLTSLNKNYSINIDSLSLTSWTCYKVKMIWEDLSWNISETDYITNICYDNVWPSIPNLVPFPNNLDENDNYSAEKQPSLTWFSSSDNENESWLKEYNLQVSLSSDFSTNFIDTNIATESYSFSSDLSDWQYFWKVRWVDNTWNTWTYSLVSDFIIDNSSASVTNIRFNSVTRWVDNIEYTSTWRIIDILADVWNWSWSCVWLDLDSIWWGSWILASSYVWGVASWTGIIIPDTWSFEWLKEIFISAQNSNCIWEIFSNWKNLWIDNTSPQIWTWITFPLAWDFLSWEWTDTTKIYYNSSSIVENNFNYLKINFFNWTEWLNIWNNLPRNWEFSYDFPDLNISNAKISLEVFDKAWNSSTQTWTEFILDSIIPNFDWTNILKYPNWWENLRWWDNIVISWSWSLITDSNLADNPISLFYSVDWWTNFSSIYEDIANSDSYNWTIPNLNSETLKIKILAKDKSWNENFDLSDWNFSIDSAKPTKISSKFLDLDENWKLDTLEIIFSENILDSSINIWDFSLNNPYLINNFNPTLNWDSENDNKIYLSITENWLDCNISDQAWCDTDAVLDLTYNQNWEWTLKVSDLVWNTLENFSETISDWVSPIILWREVLNSNNDWILDQVKIYFSETMDASQVSDQSFSLESSLWNSFTETYNQAQADWNSLILWFSNWLEFNTSDLVRSKILTSEFMDLSWNSAKVDSDFVSSSDLAKPIFKAETQKIFGQEKIKVTFSENVNITNTWTWNISDWITIESTQTWSNFITFDVSEISDTWLTPEITYSVLWDIQDWSSNLANTWSVIASDKISPEIISAETLDSDSNWNIDKVRLTFSENISDSTLTPWNFSIWTSVATGFETWTWNDAIWELVFSTEIKWTGLKDLVYNWTSVEDSIWNKLQNIQSWDLTETDWAWPAIISTYYVEWENVEDDEVIINFSEDIDDDSLNISDFIVEWTWSISSWTIITWNADDNQIKIELNSWDTRLVIWSSKIKFSWAWVVSDWTNNNTQVSWVTINWSVIINEVNWAWSTWSTADEYIELKNMWASAVSMSWWIIENATNWWNLTIPAASEIPWNWYFLISNFAETDWNSVLNISPDLVDTSLDLANSSNWNLILKDSWDNTMDSALWTWPEWDSTNFYSMERKENPWDWLDSASWYTANWRTNLDAWDEKWTPWAENIFDWDAPIFDLNTKYPLENSLHLISQPEISIEYSDVLTWIDTTNSKLYLDWDQNWSCDAAPTWSAIFTQNKVTITPSAAMPHWKNTVCIELFDNAWNQTNISWDFRIEKFTFNVEEISPVTEILTPTVDEIFDLKTKITIETYWAWLDISTIFENLTSWDDEILDQDMFYDSKISKKVWEWDFELVHDYNWYLDISNEDLETITRVEDLTVDWDLKTYEVYLNYKFNVNAIQPTWNYSWSVRFVPEISY